MARRAAIRDGALAPLPALLDRLRLRRALLRLRLTGLLGPRDVCLMRAHCIGHLTLTLGCSRRTLCGTRLRGNFRSGGAFPLSRRTFGLRDFSFAQQLVSLVLGHLTAPHHELHEISSAFDRES